MLTSTQSARKRIGFFGGSFDPIHNGHLSLARQAIEHASLDKLLLCPAHHAPLRPEKPFFEAADRLGILESICEDDPKIEGFPHEILQAKVCYTRDTILEIRKRFPQSEILLLVGNDQFQKLPQWKFIGELTLLVTFLVFSRNGHPADPPPLDHLDYQMMNNTCIDLSSTTIRSRIESGLPVKELMPKEAYRYLMEKNLISPSS